MESSRTHFEVLGLNLKASSPRKLPCPPLENSTISWTVEISLENARNLAENLRRPFFVSPKWRWHEKKFLKTLSLEKNFWRPFFLFFENTCTCVLGPWPREGLSLALASEFFSVLGLGLESRVLNSTSATNDSNLKNKKVNEHPFLLSYFLQAELVCMLKCK